MKGTYKGGRVLSTSTKYLHFFYGFDVGFTTNLLKDVQNITTNIQWFM